MNRFKIGEKIIIVIGSKDLTVLGYDVKYAGCVNVEWFDLNNKRWVLMYQEHQLKHKK